MAEEFKLPGSSFEELTRIIQAYGRTRGEVSVSEVASILGIDKTTVSRNNGFLTSLDIIEGGQKKAITPRGHALARALEHDVDVQVQWRQVVQENDFLQRILAAVKIRSGMEPAVLRSHIAYSAGQARTRASMAGTGAVIRILEEAGVLREEGGKLVVSEGAAPDEEDVSEPEHDKSTMQRGLRSSFAGANVSVQVVINANVDEIPELGVRLRKLIEDLSKPPPENGNDTDS